ncbi:MAG: YdcF family protein [bacterium]
MLYLDKILVQLAYPLGLSLSLSLLALLLVALHRPRLGMGALAIAVLWTGMWSLPAVSDPLRLSLEGQFANQPVAALPKADAVVVLGGGISSVPPDWPYPDLGRGADRVWHAARLYHAGKAPLVVITGGRLQWLGDRTSEAEAMKDFLDDLGVPSGAVLVEDRSASTRENAVFTAELLSKRGIDGVLLVTSALHMRRALATFHAAGIDAIPAATDFEVMPEPNHVLRWLPDAATLADSTRALKEFLGLWVYRWRGWAA